MYRALVGVVKNSKNAVVPDTNYSPHTFDGKTSPFARMDISDYYFLK
jgi:hypothetical protein